MVYPQKGSMAVTGAWSLKRHLASPVKALSSPDTGMYHIHRQRPWA